MSRLESIIVTMHRHNWARECVKHYVDNMWYRLRTLKLCQYIVRAGRLVVTKQWFVHELCGGEQTYVH